MWGFGLFGGGFSWFGGLLFVTIELIKIGQGFGNLWDYMNVMFDGNGKRVNLL